MSKEMKRYVVTEYGCEELTHYREYVVEIPDDVDPESIDSEALSGAAGRIGLDWDEQDSTGIEPDYYDVECPAEEMACDHLAVIRLKEGDYESPLEEVAEDEGGIS